jgi:RHS repeat-associated protein
MLMALILGVTDSARAGESSCEIKANVGFKGSMCSRQNFKIALNGTIIRGEGTDCNSNGWANTERAYTKLTLDKVYQLTADSRLCSTHIDFDIPEQFALFINGKETTNIDQGNGTKGSGDGTWEIVVRRKCACSGNAEGEAGGCSGPRIGSVNWEVGMGKLSDGQSAESISIREEALSAYIYTPSALIYSPPPRTSEVDVVRSADGSLRQVKAPQALADVVLINDSEFEIRFYHPSDVGEKVDGVYAVSGQPFVTWKIKNPDTSNTSRLQITKTQSGITDTSEYGWNPAANTWSLTTGGGARTETKTSITNSATGERTETTIVKDNNNVIASKVARVYRTFAWDEVLVREVVDPDGAALTTTFTYYENATEAGKYRKVKSVTYEDGSWEKYDYDENGNKTLIMRPWKDLSLESATEANSSVTKYYYTNYDGITLSLSPRIIDSIEEKIAGVMVRKSTFDRTGTTVNGQPAVIETETNYLSSTLVGQITSTTKYYFTATPFLVERIAFVERPDGQRDTYTYEKGNYVAAPDPALSLFTPDANGTAYRETVVHGTTVSPEGIAFKTTRESTIRDEAGRAALKETFVYTGSDYQRVGWTAFGYDNRGHLNQTLHHDGRLTTALWNGDLKESETDDSGIETTYSYDSLERVKTQTKKGLPESSSFPAQPDIVTTYTYDAEGRTLREVVTAEGISQITTTTYDVAGRVKSVTDSAGLITLNSYTNGGRAHQITLPGGATQITDRYLDGQTKRVLGTATIAKYSNYGVNSDGTRYVQEFTGSAGLASLRWTKTTTDWLGRTIQMEKPGFITGSTLVQTSVYNSKGQLQAETTTSGVNKLLADKIYEYDSLGHQIRVGSDIDMSGTLTLNSNDRIAETDSFYEQNSGVWFKVVVTKTYLKNGDATATQQTRKERLTNFPVNGAEKVVAEVIAIDVAGNQTMSTKVVNRDTKSTVSKVDTPDSTTDAISISVNGLLQSSTTTTPAAAVTYSYDALGRQTSISSPQSGTTVTAYDSTTGRVLSISQGSQLTSYEYYPSTDANAGALKTQTDANGKKVHFKYSSRGEITQNWGDTIHPIEYVYDSYGQMTELHTFRGGSNWNANSWPASTLGIMDVTRWIYHEPTGLLEKKRDALAKDTSYTYDTLSRPVARTWARLTAGSNPLTTTYSYDPLTGELSGIDYSDTTPDVTLGYDRGGRRVELTDAAGAHTLTYNAAGALETDEVTGGILDGVKVSVRYDSLLRRDSLQTLRSEATLTNQGYGYDTFSRLKTITSNGRTATHSYHPTSGLLNNTTFTGGTTISRGYDSRGRLETISTLPAVGTVFSHTYRYNNLSQRDRLTREDGSYWSYGYNERGELIGGRKYWSDNTPVAGQQTEFDYDTMGNRNFAKSGGDMQGVNLRQSTYATNSLNQYTQRTIPGAVDVLGTADNSATVTVNDQAVERKGSYFYKLLTANNAAGPVVVPVKVVGVKNNAGANGEDVVSEERGQVFVPQALEAYAYDADGNLTKDGRWAYTWDAENRLTGMEALVSVPSEARKKLEYAYDWAGRRIQKKVYAWNIAASSYQPQATIKYIYDGWNMIAELDASNALSKSYAWAFSELQIINDSSDSYFVSLDGNRNVAALVKASAGTVSASYEYDPFGQTLQATGEYGAQNPVRFSSKYTDPETGLLYYGYRYYNPQTGRWLNRDLIKEAGGINLYGFLGNDAVNNIDVLGLARESQIDDKKNPLTYSCNCGWIDWGHARPDGATDLWNNVNGRGQQSLRGGGHRVIFSETAGITISGVPIRKGVVGDYFVKNNLSLSDREAVALGIFKEVSEAFEASQGGFIQNWVMHSSFSEEDLVSNLIGFYIAVKGYSRSDVESWCKVVKSPQTNHKIWRSGGAPGSNRNWTPVFHSNATRKASCCKGKPQWPSQFGVIKAAPKGILYRDWIPRGDDLRRGRNPAPSTPQDIEEDLPNPRPFSIP